MSIEEINKTFFNILANNSEIRGVVTNVYDQVAATPSYPYIWFRSIIKSWNTFSGTGKLLHAIYEIYSKDREYSYLDQIADIIENLILKNVIWVPSYHISASQLSSYNITNSGTIISSEISFNIYLSEKNVEV